MHKTLHLFTFQSSGKLPKTHEYDDSRDGPATGLLRDKHVHIRVGSRRVVSGHKVGLVRQQNGNEITQAHGDAPRFVTDPNELANPMADGWVHGAEPLPDLLVPSSTFQTNAGAGHLPRENASIEAQVVSANAVALLKERHDIVQELAQHLVQRPAVLEGGVVLDAVLLRGGDLYGEAFGLDQTRFDDRNFGIA